MDIAVSSLHIYPVKSTAGVSVESMRIGSLGPEGDRRWMVVGSQGQFLTQRRYPLMCKITSRLSAHGVVLGFEGKTPLPLETNTFECFNTVSVWGDQVSALDCGDKAAEWLTDVLGVECRLVYMSDDCQRFVDKDYAFNQERVTFADGFPLLIISEASLIDLNSRLSNAVTMERFRPNIVVSGCGAFDEDEWKSIRIGGMRFNLVKPCSRCVIPSINPSTGEKNPEIIQALSAYRRRGREIYFGQNALVESQGSIQVGDSVQIVR